MWHKQPDFRLPAARKGRREKEKQYDNKTGNRNYSEQYMLSEQACVVIESSLSRE